jgi:hypothetical protein
MHLRVSNQETDRKDNTVGKHDPTDLDCAENFAVPAGGPLWIRDDEMHSKSCCRRVLTCAHKTSLFQDLSIRLANGSDPLPVQGSDERELTTGTLHHALLRRYTGFCNKIWRISA